MNTAKTKLLQTLNPDQQQAVSHTGSPLLILAGAGSGKTRALTYRAAYLMLERNVSPDQILLTTFTNKAAQEMQQRLVNLSGKKLPFAGTFHSLCARFLRKHGSISGIGNDFVIYDPNDQLDVIKKVLVELGIDPQLVKPRSILAAIEGAKNELVSPAEYKTFAHGPFQQAVATAYPRYQQTLNDYHALDFNDLLVEAVKLFTQYPQVREFYRHQFQHILIDEYQDTNKAQYTLTKLWLGDHQNLCVVGDASQAIYSWRGADYQNLMALKTDFPNLSIIRLEQNYRSTQNILDAAYGVIKQNQLHPILKLWTESAGGDKIQLYESLNEYEEARYCVKQALAYRDSGHSLSDTAILFRTNAQSRVFEEVFLEKGIPYVLVGGLKFYERKEIKDVLAYLRYAYNPHDQVSFTRIEKLGKRRLANFLAWLEKTPVATQQPAQLLDAILQASAYLSRFDLHDPEDQARMENVQELKSVAQNFTDLGEFLENLSLVEQDTKSTRFLTPQSVLEGEVNDAVILMTLHASKGLEFDQVFLAGMEEGIFPHSRSLNSKPDLEEERRLCYVGMTRAKQRLHLLHTRSRLYFGIRSQNLRSRFIDELPTHVFEEAGNTTGKFHQTKASQNTFVAEEVVSDFLNGKIDIEEFLNS